jgi:putative multiple sugar transport system ATP-binding protein
MKVLSGVEPAGSYEGEIHFRGREVSFADSINDSEAEGIVIIHQELALVPAPDSIAENIFLGNEQLPRRRVISWHETNARAAAPAGAGWASTEKPGDARRPARRGQAAAGRDRQGALEEREPADPRRAHRRAERRRLRAPARTHPRPARRAAASPRIIISHKLGEIAAVADATTVIRDGSTIETIDMHGGAGADRGPADGGPTPSGSDSASADGGPARTGGPAPADGGPAPAGVAPVGPTGRALIPRIIKGMVGRDMDSMFPERSVEIGEEVLRIEDWHVTHPTQPDRTLVDGVSITARAGEVVGIAGLMGAGRTELAMSVFGRSYGREISGRVFMHGRPANVRGVADAIGSGIAYVSEDRKRYGLNLIQDVRRNISAAALGKVSRTGWIDGNREISVAERYRKSLNIKTPTVLSRVGQLSGGNQQKVALSKWLFTEPDVLILDEPTRGVDVGAKYEIYTLINELAEQGKAIVVISSELPEVMGLADRIYTLSAGRITGEVSAADATQEHLMELMTMERE